MKGISSTKKTLTKISFVIAPLFYLTAIIFVGIFSIRYGISKISEQQKEIKKYKTQVSILSEKIEVLENVESELPDITSNLVNALPLEDSSLLMLYQLKNVAGQNGVVLSGLDFNAGESEESGSLRTTKFSFTASINLSGSTNIITALENYSPIVIYDSFDIVKEGSVINTDVDARTYWSPAPDKIPPVTDKIKLLTEADQAIVSGVDSLIKPTLFTSDATSDPGRIDPFTF